MWPVRRPHLKKKCFLGDWVGKYCNFFFFFCKNEKKVPSRPFLTHPAAGPETEVFFSLALGSHSQDYIDSNKLSTG